MDDDCIFCRIVSGEAPSHAVYEDETTVAYRLSVDLGVLLPGFVRTQGEKRVIENALEGLKRRVEGGRRHLETG